MCAIEIYAENVLMITDILVRNTSSSVSVASNASVNEILCVLIRRGRSGLSTSSASSSGTAVGQVQQRNLARVSQSCKNVLVV